MGDPKVSSRAYGTNLVKRSARMHVQVDAELLEVPIRPRSCVECFGVVSLPDDVEPDEPDAAPDPGWPVAAGVLNPRAAARRREEEEGEEEESDEFGEDEDESGVDEEEEEDGDFDGDFEEEEEDDFDNDVEEEEDEE
jgi:hypothetical protein